MHFRGVTIVVFRIHPARQQVFGWEPLGTDLDETLQLGLVVTGQIDERRLGVELVTDGDLARDNIRQGVDETLGTGVEIFGRGDRAEVVAVRDNRTLLN